MNIPYTTTDDQKIEIYQIAVHMKSAGIDSHFIASCVGIAEVYEGAYDLMCLWRDETDSVAKGEIIADLEEQIDEHTELPRGIVNKPRVRFRDLDAIASNVTTFKKNLRDIVDRKGGIAELAKRSGMSLPALSRFFSSASMPRRTTLYRIAEAMDLTETEVITDWIR